jgi:hypothetical protein
MPINFRHYYTTHVLSELLVIYGNQLAAKASVTPAQLNNITTLSNMAHRMANVQAALESQVHMVQTTGTPNGQPWLTGIPVVFEGVSYPFPDNLVFKISLRGGGNDASSKPIAGEFMSDFTQLKTELIASGLNESTPEGRFFSALVHNITMTVQGTCDSWYDLSDSNSWASQATQVNVLTSHQASNTTHKDAAGVCITGGGRDTGVTCNPI